MSDAARDHDGAPSGTASLPADLSDDQLAAAAVLASDALVIEELSEDEDDAFAAAVDS